MLECGLRRSAKRRERTRAQVCVSSVRVWVRLKARVRVKLEGKEVGRCGKGRKRVRALGKGYPCCDTARHQWRSFPRTHWPRSPT